MSGCATCRRPSGCWRISAVVVALARPQSTSQGENIYTEGIDIALLLDISGSMLAEDFQPNRIQAAKEVAQNFIDGRANDRIGLVIFAGQSFTQCPMTLDYRVLKNLLRQVKPGMVEDGTAIGMAIAQGVNRLKDSKAKSKVMILLTDGVNNRGEIDPITAAQIAQSFGIRIYTVGVGTVGEAPYPVQTPFGIRYQNVPVDVDEKTLKAIAEMTGAEVLPGDEQPCPEGNLCRDRQAGKDQDRSESPTGPIQNSSIRGRGSPWDCSCSKWPLPAAY